MCARTHEHRVQQLLLLAQQCYTGVNQGIHVTVCCTRLSRVPGASQHFMTLLLQQLLQYSAKRVVHPCVQQGVCA
jgi:hypothetical protein